MYGTVLFFDRERTTAYIWPDEPDASLVALRKALFPDIWHRLEIGTQLRFTTRRADIVTDVALVFEIDGEPVTTRDMLAHLCGDTQPVARTSSAF